MLLVKNFEIFTVLLLRAIEVVKMCLVTFWTENEPFLHYKNIMLGKRQNLHLSMVLVENLKILYAFVLGKIGRVRMWSTRFR